jgi:hypothetical protein
MSARSAATVKVQEDPKVSVRLLQAVATTIVCPFDGLLSGLIGAGVGFETVCAYLGLSIAALDFNLARLELPTPHNKQRRKGGARAWSDDDLRLAIYWRCLGIHPESIGLAFDRSSAGVRSKMHRLGVPTPDRKMLHKVEAGLLDRTAPDFGFPVPRAGSEPSSDRQLITSPGNVVSIVPAEHGERAADPSIPRSKIIRKGRNAAVPGQRDLNLLSVVKPSKPAPAASPEPVVADSDRPAEKPAAVCNATVPSDIPRVLGPADLIEKYQVLGRIRRPDSNHAYVTWMTLLYRGGMHYKAIGAYLSRSPSSVQAILYRMQIPRAKGRSGFGWTCDLECAVAELQQWKFELYRCKAKPDLLDSERPLFWRCKSDVGNRKRRCTRLKNQEFDDFEKYRGGNSVEIVTRAGLEAQRAETRGTAIVRTPARLHATMQGSLPIQQGAADEQFQLRGHPPVVRSGLPGNTRDQMPWAHSRNGSPSRPVAHP